MSIRDFAIKARNHAIRSVNKAARFRPSSAPYVSGDSFRVLAGHRLEAGGSLEGSAVQTGDVVFVEAMELGRFRKEALPGIRSRFVLVSHNGDPNIDEGYAELADDPRIVRWFAQNAVFRHPKMRPIPIGLENRWRHNNGVVLDFDRLRSRPRQKSMRILYGFSVGTNEAERMPALEAIRSMPLADGPKWTTSDVYRARLAAYAFALSPPGNGFDCHRTWEALYLGAVPIVKRSALFDAMPGLPAVFVEDWKEMLGWDEAFLRSRYAELSPRIAACPYLRMDYWVGEIDACRKEA